MSWWLYAGAGAAALLAARGKGTSSKKGGGTVSGPHWENGQLINAKGQVVSQRGPSVAAQGALIAPDLYQLDANNPYDKEDVAGDVNNDEDDWFFLDYATAYSQRGWDLFYRQVYLPASRVSLQAITLSPRVQNLIRAVMDATYFFHYRTDEIALPVIPKGWDINEPGWPRGPTLGMSGDNIAGSWLKDEWYPEIKGRPRWSGGETLADWRNWRWIRDRAWLQVNMTGAEAAGAGILDFLHGVGNAFTFGTGDIVHSVISGAAGSSSKGGAPVIDQVKARQIEIAGIWGDRVNQILQSAPVYQAFLRSFMGPLSWEQVQTRLTSEFEPAEKRRIGIYERYPFDPRDGTPYNPARQDMLEYELLAFGVGYGPKTPPPTTPTLRCTSSGATFYERHGLLHPTSPANVWNSYELTLPTQSDYLTAKEPVTGSTLRERVNRRARLYRALDIIGAIFFPDGAAPQGTFSYAIGSTPVQGATLPPPAAARQKELSTWSMIASQALDEPVVPSTPKAISSRAFFLTKK